MPASAEAVWLHVDGTNADELSESRRIVEAAGLIAVSEPFVLDAVSSLGESSP